MSEYLEKKYADKITIIELKKPKHIWYKVNFVCVLEDGSEIRDVIELDNLLDDELFFLVLCYISNWDDSFLQDNPDSDDEAVSGYKIPEDINFSWLADYLAHEELAIEESEDPDVAYSGNKAVSVYVREIYYYDGKTEYRIALPDMNELFNTREEMREYMNNLYNKSLTNVTQ